MPVVKAAGNSQAHLYAAPLRRAQGKQPGLVCVYTGINLIQAAKKEIFMNYGAAKKRAPEIKIKVIFMRIGFYHDIKSEAVPIMLLETFDQTETEQTK